MTTRKEHHPKPKAPPKAPTKRVTHRPPPKPLEPPPSEPEPELPLPPEAAVPATDTPVLAYVRGPNIQETCGALRDAEHRAARYAGIYKGTVFVSGIVDGHPDDQLVWLWNPTTQQVERHAHA